MTDVPVARTSGAVELSVPPARRLPGPDVVRALAMAGVVTMNYHGYLILRGAPRRSGFGSAVFDPWTGPLATRFAATFVLVAGVGVALMTRSAIGDPDRTLELRWRLVRRGLLLYGVGLLFDMIWPGTILPYYGALFVLAAGLFTVRSAWLAVIGVMAASAGWAVRWWRLERAFDGHDTGWLTDPGPRSPRGLVLDVFVNGTHPLLPWLAFFCAGIIVGRALGRRRAHQVLVAVGASMYGIARAVTALGDDDRWSVVLSDDPFERGVVYTASALGTALAAYGAIASLANRFDTSPIVDTLRRAGQVSLTIYLVHALTFNLLVDWWGVIEPGGLGTALAAAACFWVVATAGAVAWQRRFGRGPAEQLYRRLTG